MKLTENDVRVLAAVARYYVLSAAQIRRQCFPHIRDGRAVRRRLSRLVAHHYIARSAANVAFSTGNAGPAYSPTQRGCEALAVYYGDDAWCATNTRTPRLDRLYHWLDISEAHWVVDQAIASAEGVELGAWINEWQPVLDADGNPSGFVLHTQLREAPHPLSCSPDAAFLLDMAGHRRVFYVEIDRGTTGARRIAASKMKGYAELARKQVHRRHFPATTFNDFSILFVTVDARHRDRVRKEVAKQTDQRPDLWLFAARDEFTPAKMLFEPVMHDHHGHVGALIERPSVEHALDGTSSDSDQEVRHVS